MEFGFSFMRIAGLEPVYLAAPEPKSGVSASSTISAINQIARTFTDDGSIIYYFSALCNRGQAPISRFMQQGTGTNFAFRALKSNNPNIPVKVYFQRKPLDVIP